MKALSGLLFFASLLVFNTSYAKPYSCGELKHSYKLSEAQMLTMYQVHELAEDKSLAAALAAIAFYESSAGKYLSNKKDPSAGAHHVLLSHALTYLQLEPSKTNYKFVKDALMNNLGLSAAIAEQELGWWLERHKGNMFKAVRSYNQGYYWKIKNVNSRTRSWNYAVNVTKMSNKIKQCNW